MNRNNIGQFKKGSIPINKKIIDKEALKTLYLNQTPIEDLCKKFNCSKPTLYSNLDIKRPYIVSLEKRKMISVAQLGKKQSKESNKKRRISLLGPKNHQWLGGISFKKYTSDFNTIFKEYIRNRDSYRCIKCNIFEQDAKKLYNQRLCIHHIDYNKKNSIFQNCCSLCLRCHMESNFNRSSWIIFFQSLLCEKYGYEYSKNNDIIIKLNNDGYNYAN